MTDDDLPADPFGDEPGGDDLDTDDDGDIEDEPSDGDGLMTRALDGSRDGPSIQDMQTDYGLSRGPSIAGRGVIRLAHGGGVPPIFEILLGGGLTARRYSQEGDNADTSGEPGVDHGPDPRDRSRR